MAPPTPTTDENSLSCQSIAPELTLVQQPTLCKRFSRKQNQSKDSVNRSRVSLKSTQAFGASNRQEKKSEQAVHNCPLRKINGNSFVELIKSAKYIKTAQLGSGCSRHAPIPKNDTSFVLKCTNQTNANKRTVNRHVQKSSGDLRLHSGEQASSEISPRSQAMNHDAIWRELELELELRNQEVGILRQEVSRLRNGDADKNHKISELQQRVRDLSQSNSDINGRVSQACSKIRELAKQYGSAGTALGQGARNDLLQLIKEELQPQILAYLSGQTLSLQQIISNLRARVIQYEASLSKLQVHHALQMKYSAANLQLQRQNDRLTKSLLSLRNRCSSLSSRCDYLRTLNAKNRKQGSGNKQVQLFRMSEGENWQKGRSQYSKKQAGNHRHAPSGTNILSLKTQNCQQPRDASEWCWRGQEDDDISLNLSDVSAEG